MSNESVTHVTDQEVADWLMEKHGVTMAALKKQPEETQKAVINQAKGAIRAKKWGKHNRVESKKLSQDFFAKIAKKS